MQTAQQLMDVAKTKAIANPIQNKKKDPDTQPEKSFHQKEYDRQAADPDNHALANATALGKAKAIGFMNSVTNPLDRQHEISLELFRNLYEMDSRKVEKDLINKTCDEMGASAYEMSDPAYEQNVFKKYRPTGNVTSEAFAFFNNFCAAMKDKWNKAGYKSDAEFVKNYVSKYGLIPNDQLLENKAFQPKI